MKKIKLLLSLSLIALTLVYIAHASSETSKPAKPVFKVLIAEV